MARYSGLQLFTTDSIAPGSYRLRDVTRGGKAETYDLNNGTNYAGQLSILPMPITLGILPPIRMMLHWMHIGGTR
ncbi:MAG: hypothetical protein IPL22_21520 [Bacteroidetes bacterium]|nr:hypothetical protein [Bacteroidota bacterium]